MHSAVASPARQLHSSCACGYGCRLICLASKRNEEPRISRAQATLLVARHPSLLVPSQSPRHASGPSLTTRHKHSSLPPTTTANHAAKATTPIRDGRAPCRKETGHPFIYAVRSISGRSHSYSCRPQSDRGASFQCGCATK